MEKTARLLAESQTATFRYNFPYIERGKKAPDPQPVLKAAVASAIGKALEEGKGLPLFAGGKSLGARMTSATELPSEVRGLVFFGFPLHAPGRPSTERAGHLHGLSLPMLFLQGTRDAFADMGFLKPLCEKPGEKVTLHVVPEADHSFHVPKRSGRSDEEVLAEIVTVATGWMETHEG